MNAFAHNDPPSRPDPRVLRTLTETNNFALGRPAHIRLTDDGSAVLFLRSGAKSRSASLYEVDVKTGHERVLASPEQLLEGKAETLSTEEKAVRERKRISTGGLTGFEISRSGAIVLFTLSGRIWVLERKSGRAIELATPEGVILDPTLSPAGDKVAFVLDHNLFVLSLPKNLFANGNGARPKIEDVVALTSGGTEALTHGLAEFVAQEEMGRFHGYWWSSDGSALVYQTNDQRKLERLTIADASRPEIAAHTFFYPRAGKANVDVRLTVVSVDGHKRAEVRWDTERFPYLARVVWNRSGPLSILVQARDQRSEAFLSVDTASGQTTLLHQEEDDAWLNLSSSAPRWLDDGESYLWASERSGGWALERRFAKKSAGASTAQAQVVLDKSAGFFQLVHVDSTRGWIWFLGGPDPIETHLWRAPLAGGTPERVSPAGGDHEAVFAHNGSAFVLARVTLDRMPRSTIHRAVDEPAAQGHPVAPSAIELASFALEPEIKPNVELVPPERSGGFHAAILRPHGFDKTKRYPVVLHVYGGPGFTIVRSSIAGYFLPQWVADHGFIVVSIDGRGTPRRGRAFERAIRENFGSVPLDDQVAALKALATHYPELDLARVGVYGWSFGGYMAALAVLKRPDVFKVAVAGAPVADWLYYDTHYTERYLGLPEKTAQAYQAASLLTYAPKLERPLLLVHGIADDNVYFAHTLKLADALFRAQRPYELLPLVGLTHQVADPSVREALQVRIVGFLGKVLW